MIDVVLVLLNLHLQCKHGSGCRVEVSFELYLLRVRWRLNSLTTTFTEKPLRRSQAGCHSSPFTQPLALTPWELLNELLWTSFIIIQMPSVAESKLVSFPCLPFCRTQLYSLGTVCTYVSGAAPLPSPHPSWAMLFLIYRGLRNPRNMLFFFCFSFNRSSLSSVMKVHKTLLGRFCDFSVSRKILLQQNL